MFFSIIVSVYNTEAYLDKCLQSILHQTFTDFEVILIDDGSQDKSAEICEKYAQIDKRILLIHQENQGVSATRNTALGMASAPYIIWVDSDDWICPQMYETLYRRLIEKQAQISCCGIDRCTDDGHQSYFNPNVAEAFTLNRVDALKELTRNQRITNSVCDKLYRSDLFDKLRMTTGILFEDFQVQPHCIAQAERVTYTAEPLYCYYLSPQSILRGNYSIRQYDSIRISRECIGFYQKNFAECVPYAQAEHISLVLDMIYRSTGKPEWKELRKELIREMRRPLLRAAVQKLEKKNKMKLWVLRLNTFLYTKVMTMYYMHSA